MAATILALLFVIVYALCWLLNRFAIPHKKLNPGYTYVAVCGLLFLNQLRLAMASRVDPYVFGTIFGTWLIPIVIGLLIAVKFARQNPGSVPWGAPKPEGKVDALGQTASTPDKPPSWMKE